MICQTIARRRTKTLFPHLLLVSVILAIEGCGYIDRVNVSSDGTQGNGALYTSNYNPALSADGRFVAFDSTANNLVPDDTNTVADVFVRDVLQGITNRVSVSTAGASANAAATRPSISADGRFICFQSAANNLVTYDYDSRLDVFLRDTVAGTTTRINQTSAGNPYAPISSASCSISSNGRFVAFASNAIEYTAFPPPPFTDLPPTQIMVYDRDTGQVKNVSKSITGNYSGSFSFAGATSNNPSISGDGRYVTFSSTATNIVAGDTEGQQDVFLHDQQTNTTTRVTEDSAGIGWNRGTWYPKISADGRYIAFEDTSTGYTQNVYRYDRIADAIDLVSVNMYGEPSPSGNNGSPAISADGRYIAFESGAQDLVISDANTSLDVFVRDMVTGITTRVSVDENGVEGNSHSSFAPPAISHDGRYVAFDTRATNLVPNDANGNAEDLIIRAVPDVAVTSVTPDQLTIGATTAVTITGTNFLDGAMLQMGNAQISNSVVVDENTITANVTIPAGSPVGALEVLVALPGTGPGPLTGVIGTCTDCVTLAIGPGC